MRKFLTWLQLLFRDYATYKLFRLEDYGTPWLGMGSQGMDVLSDRYIFQGSDQDGKASLVVIDTKTKSILGEMLVPLEGCHMNNINIGRKYRRDDKFPMLYISECKNKRRCYVMRLENDANYYSLVQDIWFVSDSHYGKSQNAFDWFVDGYYIYTFGMTGNEGEMEIIKFNLPTHLGMVKLTDKDIISSFTIQDCHVYQGSKVIGGKLYAPFGLGTDEYPTCLKIIDLDNGIVERSINIKGLGEIEAISKYEDGFIVVNNAINPTYTYLKI